MSPNDLSTKEASHRRSEKVASLLLVFFVSLYFLTANGRICAGDEETMYRVTRNLVERGDIAVQKETVLIGAMSLKGLIPRRAYTFQTNYASPGVSGRYYSKYGLGQSLISVPFYLLGRALSKLIPSLGPQYLSKLSVAMLNPLVTTATCWLLFVFGRALGFSVTTSLWLSLAYGLSSMAWAYTKTFFSQPSTAFLLLAAAYAAHRFRYEGKVKQLLLAGLCLGLAILFRMAALITLPAFILYLLLPTRKEHGPLRRYAAFLGPVVAVLLISAWYNLIRFGSVLETGYAEVAWITPLPAGLYGLLFSPGKSLFLYNPILFLAIGGLVSFYIKHRAEALLFGLLILSYLAFHVPYNFWSGGWNWGPRFLLPVVPFLSLSIGPLLEDAKIKGGRTSMALLLILGLLIQTPAILVDHSRYLISLSERYPDDFYDRTIYQPGFSPVLKQWPMALEVGRLFGRREMREEMKAILAERRAAAAGQETWGNAVSDELLWESEFFRLNVPDFWWVHLYLLGVQPGYILILMLPFLALTLGCGALLLGQAVRDQESLMVSTRL